MFKYDPTQQGDKTRENKEKQEEIKKDEEFIESYGKGSNQEIVSKYNNSLQINWDHIMNKKLKAAYENSGDKSFSSSNS